MPKLRRAIAMTAATLALASGVGIASASAASANSDTYCLHSTCLSLTNYYYSWGQYADGYICNYQSADNSFHVWLQDSTKNRQITYATLDVASGHCSEISGYPFAWGDSVQIFAQSGGNWTYGSNPIPPSWS